MGTLTLQLSSYSIIYVSGGSNDGDPDQTGTAGQALAEPFVVQVLDPYSVGASDLVVSFTVEDGGGSVAEEEVFTDGGGFASTTLTLGTDASAENRVVARTDAVSGQNVTFLAYGEPDVPHHLSVTGDEQTGTVGQPLAEDLVVTVLDQYDNTVPGETVTFTPEANCGSADPTSAVTDAAGQASATWTLDTLLETSAGEQTLVAAVESTALEHTFRAVNHADAPFAMTKVSGDGQLWHVDAELPEPLAVSVEDTYGNPGYGWDVSWSAIDGGLCDPVSSPVGLDGLASTTATMGPTAGAQSFTATCDALDVTFGATATGHYIDYIFPGRAWVERSWDLDVEVFGAGFVNDANTKVIWDVGASEQELTPTTIEEDRIVATLTADLFDTAREVPVTVEQTADGRCATVDFTLGGVLPDTGQTSCYDNDYEITCPAEGEDFWGQDAQFGWDLHVTPAARFERSEPVADEPVVFDNITQLEWQGCAAGQGGLDCGAGSASELSWQEAADHCEALDWGGFDDWRLPSAKELAGIVDAGRYDPSIDEAAFPGTPGDRFWSSSVRADAPSYARYVAFDVGLVYYYDKNYDGRVRCVRRGP